MFFHKHPKLQHDVSHDLFLNFGAYGQEVELASFSSNGMRVLTVHEIGIARVWDVSTGELVGEIKPSSPLQGQDVGPTTEPFQVFIEAAALNPTGDFALLGLNDGTAGVFTVTDGKRLSTLYDPTREPATGWELIRAVAYSPDGSLALVGFYGRTVGVWHAEDAAEVAVLRHPEALRLHSHLIGPRPSLVSSVAASADNRYVFAGDADMTASIWDLEARQLVFAAQEHIENILGFHSANAQLQWATSGGTVWEANGNTLPMRVLQTGENWQEVVFSPDGRELLVRTAGGQVKQWKLKGESTVLSELGQGRWSHRAQTLGYGKDNDVCFYPTGTNRILLHSASGTPILERNAQLARVALSPDANWLVTEGWSGRIELWSVASGEQTACSLTYRGISQFAFSPNGSLIAIAEMWHINNGGPYPVHLCSLPDLQPFAHLRGHDHHIFGLAFAPDNSWLVSTSLDRTVRLWEVQTGACKQTQQRAVPDLDMYTLHVLSDGRILVFREQHIEVWNSRFQRLAVLSIGPGYNRAWTVSADQQSLLIAQPMQIVQIWNLITGERVGTYEATIARPEQLPSDELLRHQPAAGGYVWRGWGGPYLHTGDGPRGWVTPLTLSGNSSETVIPCKSAAAHISLEPTSQLIKLLPLQGRMRAGCIVNGTMLLINAKGKLFASPQLSQ